MAAGSGQARGSGGGPRGEALHGGARQGCPRRLRHGDGARALTPAGPPRARTGRGARPRGLRRAFLLAEESAQAAPGGFADKPPADALADLALLDRVHVAQEARQRVAVSYTHLTLPTIYSV